MKVILFLIEVVLFLIVNFSVNAEEERKWVAVERATRQVTINGFTRAHSKMPVATEVGGKVEHVYADEGEPIPADDKFACLDDTFVQIDIKSAQNEIAQHQVDINYYRKEVSRHQKLVEKNTAAVSTLDRLKKDLNSSVRSLQAASIRKMRLEELRQRHCVKAPAGWLVIERYIEPGQWVKEGEVLAQIGDYSRLIVPMALTEDELKAVNRKPDKISFVIKGYDLKVPARIDHISPAFDESTRKILVDFLIEEGFPRFRGGRRVELNLDIPSYDSGFAIPAQALEERFEEYWVQRKDGKRIRVELLNNHHDGTIRIVSPEIKLGDQLLLLHP